MDFAETLIGVRRAEEFRQGDATLTRAGDDAIVGFRADVCKNGLRFRGEGFGERDIGPTGDEVAVGRSARVADQDDFHTQATSVR